MKGEVVSAPGLCGRGHGASVDGRQHTYTDRLGWASVPKKRGTYPHSDSLWGVRSQMEQIGWHQGVGSLNRKRSPSQSMGKSVGKQSFKGIRRWLHKGWNGTGTQNLCGGRASLQEDASTKGFRRLSRAKSMHLWDGLAQVYRTQPEQRWCPCRQLRAHNCANSLSRKRSYGGGTWDHIEGFIQQASTSGTPLFKTDDKGQQEWMLRCWIGSWGHWC